LVRFEFKSGTISFCFSFTIVSFGESYLLVLWCAGGRCGMACIDEDRGRSRRPGAEDCGWSHRSGTQWPGDREVRWHRVWYAPCTWRQGVRISWLSLKTKVDGLSVVWTQNHWDDFCWFGLKTSGDGFRSFFASKLVAMVSSGLASKPAVTIFSSLFSKLVVTVSPSLASKPAVVFLVEPQNQGGVGFPDLGLKTGSFGLLIWVSKSP
jgi:hypothetical protein